MSQMIRAIGDESGSRILLAYPIDISIESQQFLVVPLKHSFVGCAPFGRQNAELIFSGQGVRDCILPIRVIGKEGLLNDGWNPLCVLKSIWTYTILTGPMSIPERYTRQELESQEIKPKSN